MGLFAIVAVIGLSFFLGDSRNRISFDAGIIDAVFNAANRETRGLEVAAFAIGDGEFHHSGRSARRTPKHCFPEWWRTIELSLSNAMFAFFLKA